MADGHPLENEDVFVTIELRHRPTGAVATGVAHAPADEEPTMAAAVDKAFGIASDGLLNELEQRGGG